MATLSATVVGTIDLSSMGAKIQASMRGAVESAAILVERSAGKKFTGYQSGRSDASVIQRRTSHLRQSLNHQVSAAGDGVEARIGYRRGDVDKYARMVEEGGTITARGRVLAIPIGAALSPAGVPKYASPRDVKGGFWISRPGHPPIFAVKAGGPRSERLDLLFVGKKRVTIRARHVLKRSLEDARPQIVESFSKGIGAALKARFGG